jgi:hypothetical protein
MDRQGGSSTQTGQTAERPSGQGARPRKRSGKRRR